MEEAQTLNVVLAGPAECEGRWGTALGASGGLPPRHSIAFRLDCDLAPGATLRSGRHSPSTGSMAAGWPPGPGHYATRPAGSAGSPTLPVEATTGTPQDWGTETVWIILLAVVFFCCIRNPKSYTDPRDWGSWRKCDEWPFSPVPAIQEGFSLTLLVLDLP